ncbi:heparan-alpha-glucosaminide N-acetyltransferase domain-containing protein [Lentzea aerocolonigenes]|uniref:heparan-alpha-glucosaminide N-acetyltransferase domain-containing protein n=1 Tax=Lentzea aerocolonigenes TaxID=68170 RepID=UPI00055F5F00|nr:heparan-alpha-glucosaminide N-acetyltransferase domain-containing protein [Lentzea aerocolonigenes]MCP2243984.1 putative membrane protein YeiB [Lentzea aerocolonigenes]
MGRLVGVDLARALAVFGMYVVHLGPSTTNASGIGAWVRHLTEGRSSALFATLAGFSLMLIAGRLEPKTGVAGRQAKARIAIRAAVLLVLGTVMINLYGDVVILASYGLFFLLALPLVRLSAKTLAIIAAGVAVFGPLLAFGLKVLITEPARAAAKAYDPLAQLGGAGLLDLTLTGFYPAIPWMAFIIAGMALGRLDVTSSAVRKRLAVFGPALAVFAYGTSWLLAQLIDGVREAAEMQSARGPGSGSGMGKGPKDIGAMGDMGSMPPNTTGSGWSLLTSGPHSGMPFDVIGCIGVAITVIVLAMMAIDRLPLLQRLAAPIIAVGTMSLTAYVGHFLLSSQMSGASGAPGDSMTGVTAGSEAQASWTPVLMFIFGAMAFAFIWSRFFRRGPLEYLLNLATKPAKFIR